MTAVHPAAQRPQTSQVLFRRLLGGKQDVRVGRVQITVGGVQQSALPVVDAEPAPRRTGRDEVFGDADPVQVFEGAGLERCRSAAGLHAGVAVDEDVVHAQQPQAHGQGQSYGTGADDQNVRVRWEGWEGWEW